ncbi:MAG: molybdate ABC transporter substrate-binding protein [Paracoccus sp. (in: a-proteobacteria)]|nr:molybdate ABC transporter substrate-binding protein [Paracoccus sp. (in: a-proteobacteria)]
MLRPMIAAAMLSPSLVAAEPLDLYAAGSLRAALSEVAAAFTTATGVEVRTEFAPSGLLRERIEAGETVSVFASANMAHPQALAAQGLGGPVVLFAGNRLCGLARPGLEVTEASLLEAMLSDEVSLGISTPEADPSGDYAWTLFEKAEALSPGAEPALKDRAQQLTGGPDSAAAPEGRNLYGWHVAEGRADLFLTYCTNAHLAQRENPDLQIVSVPPALSVGADYGLTVLQDRPEAAQLALFILSPEGQSILAGYGFEAPTLPSE